MIIKQPTEKIKILGAGLVCLDIIKAGNTIKYYNGGSCGNVVTAMSFLGCSSDVISRQYSDVAGQILQSNFNRFGVNNIIVGKGQVQTPRIIEQLNLSDGNYFGHKFLFQCPNCQEELPKLKSLSNADARLVLRNTLNYNSLYTDRISPGIKLLRDYMNGQNAWTVYEPNSCRNIKALFSNATESAFVKFSSEKISFQVADGLRESCENSKTVLIVQTLGEHGLRFSFRKKNNKFSAWTSLPAQPISHLIDTSGAGDWCTAGTLFNLITNYPCKPSFLTKNIVISALQYGQALSAISCSFIGGQGLMYAKNKNDFTRKLFDNLSIKTNKSHDPMIPLNINLAKSCSMCLQ